jgi:hypothetical protein
VGASAEEAAPAVAEVGGSAVEEKAEKTRVELAANTPIGPGAGKAAAVAGAAAVATLAMGSSAAATLTVGAQHAAPAAHVSAVTRTRTEETTTEIGAAVAVTPAIPRRVAASGGQADSSDEDAHVPRAEIGVGAGKQTTPARTTAESDMGLKYPGNWGDMSRDARKSWLKKRAKHKGRT